MKRKIKWWMYLFPLAFLSLSAVILAEGATPGNESSVQSKWFASVFDRGSENATIILPESISTDKDVYSVYVGGTIDISPAFSPENTSDKRYSYNVVSSPEVISIEGASFTGLKEGEAVVEAVSEALPALKKTFKIEVEAETIKTLSLSGESSIVKGMTSRLSVTSNKKELSLDEVGFSSSNEEVATIDSRGYVHAKGLGKAFLFCYSKQNPSVASSRFEIEVIAGEFTPTLSMEYEPEISVYVGENKLIEPTFNLDCSDKSIYVSSLPEGLSFQDGVLTPTEEGEYNLVVSSVNNEALSFSLKVSALEVKPVSISVSFSSIQYGQTKKLEYSLSSEIKGLPVTHPEVNFSSSSPEIATVDENGYLLGLKKGSADITVSWKKDPSIKGKATIAFTSMDGVKFDNINYIVRKTIGHFGSFAVTAVFGILTCFFFFKRKTPFWISLSLTLVYGFVLAALSEFLQIFAGSRGPSWNDVGIDFSGYASGFAVTFLIAYFVYRTLSKRRRACIDNEPKES